MNLHLLGASTPTGVIFSYLLRSIRSHYKLFPYSRKSNEFLLDLTQPSSSFLVEADQPSYLVSFAPLWLLAPYLESQYKQHPSGLSNLNGIIACSSSSVLTKRYSYNLFDKHLAQRLWSSEDSLLTLSDTCSIPINIIRPTLVYGHVDDIQDNNLSFIIALLRRFPVIPLPFSCGLRQPIHAAQLAHLSLELLYSMGTSTVTPHSSVLTVGGDTTLSYSDMVIALQASLPPHDSAQNCKVMLIPDIIFYIILFPILIFSPKQFESFMRIFANLSGFTPVHTLLSTNPTPFPASNYLHELVKKFNVERC